MNKIFTLPTLTLLTLAASLSQVNPAHAQVQIPDRYRDVIRDILGPGTTPAPNPTTVPAPSGPSRGNDLGNTDGAVTRAMNLARQAAERTNGGLSVYRAEPAMYGPSEKAPYVVNRDGSLTFTFLGGKPTEPPTIQSVVTVARDGSNVNMDYNGPIRSAK